jgi:hypothetical protein
MKLRSAPGRAVSFNVTEPVIDPGRIVERLDRFATAGVELVLLTETPAANQHLTVAIYAGDEPAEAVPCEA